MLYMRAFNMVEDITKIHVPFHYSVKGKCKSGGCIMAWHYRNQYKWRSTRDISYLCYKATNNICNAQALFFVFVFIQAIYSLNASLIFEGRVGYACAFTR